MDKDGAISFQHVRRTGKSIIQPEVMAKALERTMEEGYWWANTAWAVAYRIYQMEGFTGSIRQFVREVQEWPWQKTLAGKVPTAKINGNTVVELTENNGTYTGSFVMPTRGRHWKSTLNRATICSTMAINIHF